MAIDSIAGGDVGKLGATKSLEARPKEAVEHKLKDGESSEDRQIAKTDNPSVMSTPMPGDEDEKKTNIVA